MNSEENDQIVKDEAVAQGDGVKSEAVVQGDEHAAAPEAADERAGEHAGEAHPAEAEASSENAADEANDHEAVETAEDSSGDTAGDSDDVEARDDASGDAEDEDPADEADGNAGNDDADQGPTFDDLGLSGDVARAVRRVGFESPSPIQAETIPVLMEGKDVVGQAQTGTGKTAAFALPILSRVDRHDRGTQALVLAPTRELALQVADAFQSFADNLGGIHVLPIYGGQAYGVQLSGLRRGAQIVVGTPGRVIDHLERGSLDISALRFLVLDEADEMLQMGFQEDVERILADTPEDKQTALFSATMPASIRRLAKQYLQEPHEITVKAETRTATNITQRYLMVAHRNKLDALTRILEVTEFAAMILFVRTKNETEEVAERLRARGFSAAAINGDMPQQARERTVDQLKDGRLDILVATDVAARGLDVERISHVVNYDIPHDTEAYVHRIGRTGRAGRDGEAILFVTPRERRMLRSIERATNADLVEMDLPTVDEVNDARKSKFADAITAALEDNQLELFRGLVKRYSEDNDVPIEDIAAALAVQAQSGDEFLMKEAPREKGRRDRDRGDRRERGGRRFERNENMQTYRVNLGKEQHVRPGSIVGAIANEGGLDSKDFGRITIMRDFSLVDLPKDLPEDFLDRLADTRIAGELINIEKDRGPRGGGRRGGRGDRDERGGRRGGGRWGGRGGRDERGDREDRGGRRGGWQDRGPRGGGHRGDRDDRGWRDGGNRGGRGNRGWRD